MLPGLAISNHHSHMSKLVESFQKHKETLFSQYFILPFLHTMLVVSAYNKGVLCGFSGPVHDCESSKILFSG